MSPSGVFRDIFSADEIRAMLRELAEKGSITSVSGAAKSGSFARMDVLQQAIELRYALQCATGSGGPRKVEQRLFRC